jgi:diacylglycerol kinase (ATP)
VDVSTSNGRGIEHLSYARVIVNPRAGAGSTAKKWPQIMDLMKSIGLAFEHDLTEAPGHAIEIAKLAAKKGYEMVVSVGGDGTLNEIVNGLYDAGGLEDVLLGIIGTGTGTDYIRTVGVPRHYKEACQCLMNRRKMLVDLGIVEYANGDQLMKRVFVNFAGLGFDAEVVKATTQRFKTLGSIPSYLMGLLSTLLLHKNKEVSLKLDGIVDNRKACAVIISNGKYGGGGMFVAPNADPTDGFLDVLIIDDLSKLDLLWSLPRIYRGTHLTHPKVTVQRVRQIDIESSQRIPLQADGELLGDTPASFHVLPAALNIVI